MKKILLIVLVLLIASLFVGEAFALKGNTTKIDSIKQESWIKSGYAARNSSVIIEESWIKSEGALVRAPIISGYTAKNSTIISGYVIIFHSPIARNLLYYESTLPAGKPLITTGSH